MLQQKNGGHEPLDTAESSTRKAFDYMRWLPVKWEAVHDICNYDEKQILSSYYFPDIRYHTRWKELEENDFIFGEIAEHYELKGYAPLAKRRGNGISLILTKLPDTIAALWTPECRKKNGNSKNFTISISF